MLSRSRGRTLRPETSTPSRTRSPPIRPMPTFIRRRCRRARFAGRSTKATSTKNTTITRVTNTDKPGCSSSHAVLPGRNIEPGALVRGTLADIGVAVGAQHIDRPGQRLTIGALARDEHDTGLNLVADLEDEPDRAAVVEQAHRLAVAEMARAGFLRVQDAAGRALASAQVGHAGKAVWL